MSDSNASASGGIGFFGVLTIVFIVLKLMGKIAWSWFWVLSPILLPLIIGLTIGAIILSIVLICKTIYNKRQKRRNMRGKN